MRFLGVDLAWRSQPSGVCCLEYRESGLYLVALHRLDHRDQVLGWVDALAPSPTPALVAVDAPTIVTNQQGMRPCDRLCHQYFGKYDAGAYPANLASPFIGNTLAFAEELLARGFSHGADLVPQREGRWQIEVFPHPATVHLFGLSKILKYKKGKLGDRQGQLALLARLLLEQLPLANTEPLQSMYHDLQNGKISGKVLKAYEDQLDSVLCAFVAYHWWRWGRAKNLVLGDQTTGFIVVPTASP
jgi:predicted RNase H-like nuclease